MMFAICPDVVYTIDVRQKTMASPLSLGDIGYQMGSDIREERLPPSWQWLMVNMIRLTSFISKCAYLFDCE